MRETDKAARTKAWVRAVKKLHWNGEAGQHFRATIGKLLRFGRDTLELNQRAKESYNAAWARVEGTIVGKDQAEALEKWQESENKKIDTRFKEETYAERVERDKRETDKLRADIRKVKAEAAKTDAEIAKTNAEADLLRAQAVKMRIDAAILLVDRLVQAKVWLVPDNNGAMHLVPLPENADLSKLFQLLVSREMLDGLHFQAIEDRPGEDTEH